MVTSVDCEGRDAERGRRIVGRWPLEDDGYSPPGNNWLRQLERHSVVENEMGEKREMRNGEMDAHDNLATARKDAIIISK